MASGVLKAFVSSTFDDLKEHRAHVIRQLRMAGIFVDPMEDWTAASDEPKRFSRERMADCDFCVLLVALRRGYVPPGETKSITQLEYQAALDAGIDILPYLLDEASPWPHAYVELHKDPAIAQWRQELEERHGRALFATDPASLQVGPAVTRWVTEQARKGAKVGDDWIQLISNLLNLPKNEPRTWRIAADLLPHALEAVRAAYSASAPTPDARKAAEAPAPADATAALKPLHAGAQQYFDESRARFERTCFVILPFGVKTLANGRQIDFDAAYQKVFRPAIEGVGLEAVRVDQENFVGATPLDTYQYLEYSRVVLADISALSANVFYELGIRHRARGSGTVVVREVSSDLSPFDLSYVRVIEYECSDDRNAERSVSRLKEVLSFASQGQAESSPVSFALQRDSTHEG